MLQAKEQKRLENIYQRVINGGTDGEKAAAQNVLQKMCDKHKIRLSDYIKDATFDMDCRSDEEKRAEKEANARARVEREKKAKQSKKGKKTSAKAEAKTEAPKKEKKVSRRGVIIQMIKDNIWDQETLASFLTELGFGDDSTNKKAISGTLYDMKRNQDWIVSQNADGRVCIRVDNKEKK